MSLSNAVINPVSEIVISETCFPFNTPFLFASKIACLIACFSLSERVPPRLFVKSWTCTTNLSVAKFESVLLPVTFLFSLLSELTE